jgi:catechol 2,3-dioxygenase-like lactoylglutathione lyase family enzyme
MIIASDIEASKQFYVDLLSETVLLDLGTFVVMDGFSIMAREAWSAETQDGAAPGRASGSSFVLYFEEYDLDSFVNYLSHEETPIEVFSPLFETPWGQRKIRVLDPDGYVIEVAEPMDEVVLRLLDSGMAQEEVASKTMMPDQFVRDCDLARRK